MANSNDPKKTIKITLVKSLIGYPKRQKDTAHALGLRKIHQTVEHIDSPALRGMVAKIVHLVTVEE